MKFGKCEVAIKVPAQEEQVTIDFALQQYN
jgi:hypothetical protein